MGIRVLLLPLTTGFTVNWQSIAFIHSIVLDFIVVKLGLFSFPNSLDHGGIVVQIVTNFIITIVTILTSE